MGTVAVLRLDAGLRRMKGPKGMTTTLTCVYGTVGGCKTERGSLDFWCFSVLWDQPCSYWVHVSISEGPLQPQQALSCKKVLDVTCEACARSGFLRETLTTGENV